MMQKQGISRWWRLAGGVSMTLALGTLYAWSVFVAPLEKQFGWSRADTSMVFTIAAAVFGLSFVLAGRLQDRFGPLPCSIAGSLLISLGFYLDAADRHHARTGILDASRNRLNPGGVVLSLAAEADPLPTESS